MINLSTRQVARAGRRAHIILLRRNHFRPKTHLMMDKCSPPPTRRQMNGAGRKIMGWNINLFFPAAESSTTMLRVISSQRNTMFSSIRIHLTGSASASRREPAPMYLCSERKGPLGQMAPLQATTAEQQPRLQTAAPE